MATSLLHGHFGGPHLQFRCVYYYDILYILFFICSKCINTSIFFDFNTSVCILKKLLITWVSNQDIQGLKASKSRFNFKSSSMLAS